MDKIIEKLIKEKENLDSLIGKLETFLESDLSDGIEMTQISLLNIQLKSMHTYSQCLLERINLLQAHKNY